MLIYQIPNAAQSSFWFVCDSQATIDAIPVNEKTGRKIVNPSECSVGGQPEADALLLQYQNDWLTKQKGLFVVNLQTTVEGGVVWTVVDLDTEPDNTERMYFVFDTTTGLYNEAVGLNSAKAELAATKQKYLVFTGTNQYKTMTSWT